MIVHISADYPDAVAPAKTRAVAALLEATADRFAHRVYSLNRVGGWRGWLSPGRVRSVADDGAVASWHYYAPGRGAFLALSMRRVASAIGRDLKARNLRPALVQGHKLSFEGIAARALAGRLGVPFALTLQGNTDQKVLRARRDLRGLYRRVWEEAAAVAAFSPWIARWCERELGPRTPPAEALPCMLVRDELLTPQAAPALVVTAFNLDDWRNKNLEALVAACVRARATAPELRLEIAGTGSEASVAAVDALIARAGAEAFARRIGWIGPDAIQGWMNRAALFAMPSRRESFGMVFVEALLGGCPIVYPRGAAVDGYFDGAAFAFGIDAGDPASIAAAIADALVRQDEVKRALAEWQRSLAAEAFRRPAIAANYQRMLEEALR